MGVAFDRLLEDFEGPFEKITALARVPTGTVEGAPRAAGFLLDHRTNDAAIAVNRLLKEGENVFWLREPFEAAAKTYPPGTIYIPAQSFIAGKLESLSASVGLRFVGIEKPPQGKILRLKPIRIGLWDQYGGSMASGWARWLYTAACGYTAQGEPTAPQELRRVSVEG